MVRIVGLIVFIGFTIIFVVGGSYIFPPSVEEIEEVLEYDSIGDEIPEEGLEDLNEIYWPGKDSIITGYDTI